ncbi:MAG: hypothetical protein ACLR5Q_01795 [Coprococcus sp.]
MIHRDCGSISILGRDNATEMQSLKEDIGVVLDEVGLPECLNRRQVGNIMALTFKNWDSDYFEALCGKLGVRIRRNLVSIQGYEDEDRH